MTVVEFSRTPDGMREQLHRLLGRELPVNLNRGLLEAALRIEQTIGDSDGRILSNFGRPLVPLSTETPEEISIFIGRIPEELPDVAKERIRQIRSRIELSDGRVVVDCYPDGNIPAGVTSGDRYVVLPSLPGAGNGN